MQVPLHPVIVHLPIALTIILPFLILVFTFLIKSNKLSAQTWLVIIGLQLVTTVSGYVALETGENEEALVQKVVDKKLIHHHEESAEIFVGSTVLALVLSVAVFFLRRELQFPVHLIVCVISFISCYLVYETGGTGGELVYRHGAAGAYVKTEMIPPPSPNEGLLPTDDLNTSESPVPADENESLKEDDNDYGNSDEALEVEEDSSKQED